MLVFSLILYATAAILFMLSYSIYNGNTHLIHEYHRTKVTDQYAYGKAFAGALVILPLAFSISATTALLGESKLIMCVTMGILFAGIIFSLLGIIFVQKKYNKGIF